MIDLHCHILPGLDDGATDLAQSLAMCALAADNGITHIVATPHHLNGVHTNPGATILLALESLKQEIASQGIAITLLPGSDLHMDHQLLKRIESGDALTINNSGRFILLEPPNFFDPDALPRKVFDLTVKGITPIITHPERNETVMSRKGLIEQCIRGGALIQVTAGSLSGRFGPRAKHRAMELLSARMIHVLATDAHNTTTRPPDMTSAYHIVTEILGQEEADAMVTVRPQAIINGESPIIPPIIETPHHDGWLTRILARFSSGSNNS